MITTDQGSEFRVQKPHEFCSDNGAGDHHLTSCYHPQANGLDKQLSQTLTRCLTKYLDRKEDWDIPLPAAICGYNMGLQESIKCTSFEAMFGRQPRLPFDLNHMEHHSEGY